MACLANLWRIELQCDLPCKPFRLYSDAPLAHLIGAQAKQGWEKGETSLGSSPILRLATFASASPLANQKWGNANPGQLRETSMDPKSRELLRITLPPGYEGARRSRTSSSA